MTSPGKRGSEDSRSLGQQVLRIAYPLLMLVGIPGLGGWLVHAAYPLWGLTFLLGLAIACSFAVERLIPYNDDWGRSHEDTARDWIHFVVNESMNILSLAMLPLLVGALPWRARWPNHWPLLAQMGLAIIVLDFGVTVTHRLSHRIPVLWRFHAVHHSVKRFYGFNGLMKHPLHQTIEMAVGAAPLVMLGMPAPIAALLALSTAIQLLLQHSNADYATGPFVRILALNKGHRFHHLRWAGIGDVNFGLFTHVWDILGGTWSYDPSKSFTSEDLGIEGKPNYPRNYWDQIKQPLKS